MAEHIDKGISDAHYVELGCGRVHWYVHPPEANDQCRRRTRRTEVIDLSDPLDGDRPSTGGGPITRQTWAELAEHAAQMAARAYAPYSDVRVGAAGMTDDGRIVLGCNVENASSGLGICAEVNLVGSLVATGGGRLLGLSVLAGDGKPIMPCGRCRQVLYEFGGAELLIATTQGVMTLGELLPHPFGPQDVAGRAG